MTTTWRQLIAEAMAGHGESWADVVGTALVENRDTYSDAAPHEPSLDRPFHSGYGTAEGDFFTVWTTSRVYFPVVYDGAESVGSAPRNPCDEACEHVGGQ